MKSTTKLFAVLFVLIFAVAAIAADFTTGSIRISNEATVAGTKLAPGDYKVTIEGKGPEVKVSFAQNGSVKATATGTMTEEAKAPEYSSVLTNKTDNVVKISELRLAKTKGVVKF